MEEESKVEVTVLSKPKVQAAIVGANIQVLE